MYFWYVLKKYLRSFLLILFSLSFFFVVIDLVANHTRLPDSSNLQVLYIYYITLYSMDLFYPLALVFGFLLAIYYMIKFNELVSFYSTGFTVKKLLKPFMFLAFFVYFLFLGFESGKFAYFREYANSILNKNRITGSNLFLKYENKIIYISKIKPLRKTAVDLKVFFIKNYKVYKIISAKKAVFKNDRWYVNDALITHIYDDRIEKEHKSLQMLEGFKPKIISNLKKLTSISLYDAFLAIRLFKDVSVNTILSMIFYKVFTPLSLIGIIIILMFKSPIHQRVSNVSLFLVKSVFLTIVIWGVELMIYKFAKQGVVSAYALTVPFFAIFGYGLYILIKEK